MAGNRSVGGLSAWKEEEAYGQGASSTRRLEDLLDPSAWSDSEDGPARDEGTDSNVGAGLPLKSTTSEIRTLAPSLGHSLDTLEDLKPSSRSPLRVPVRHESWRVKFDRGQTIKMHRKSLVPDTVDGGESAFSEGEKHFLIFHPRSSRRMTWDLLVLAVLIYSCMIVPYDIAFFPSEVQCDGVWFFLDGIIDTLFMVDISLNFRTAFVTSENRRMDLKAKSGSKDVLKLASKSNLETDPWKIAKYYSDPRELIRGDGGGFFLLDLLGTIPFDWFLCSTALGAVDEQEAESLNAATVARMPKFVKILSAMRMFKFLLLSRIGKMIRRVRDRLHINPGLLHLMQFLLFLVLCTHWFACFFFFLNTLLDDDESMTHLPGGKHTCWGEQFLVANPFGDLERPYCHKIDGIQTDPECIEMTPGRQYLTSMYWATTSLTTVGLGDITAITVYEMGFSLIVLLAGGFIFSYMVVNVSRMLGKINIHAKEKRDRMYELDFFLHRERIPPNLKRRVRENFRRTLEAQRRIPDYLKDFSGSLRKDIYLQLFKETVLKVPAFHGFSDSATFYIIEKFQFNNKPSGETLFREGELGSWMYFLHQGTVELTFGGPNIGAGAPFKVQVVAGGFFGENAILGVPERRATAVTTSWCLLYALTVDDVEDALQKYPQAGLSFQQFKDRMMLQAAKMAEGAGKLSPATKSVMTPFMVLRGIRRFRGKFTPQGAMRAVNKARRPSVDSRSDQDTDSTKSLLVPRGELLSSPTGIFKNSSETGSFKYSGEAGSANNSGKAGSLSPEMRGGNRARRRRKSLQSSPDPNRADESTRMPSDQSEKMFVTRDGVLSEPEGAAESPSHFSQRSLFDDSLEIVKAPVYLDQLAAHAPVSLEAANKAIAILTADIAALQEYAKGLRSMNTQYHQLCVKQGQKIKDLQAIVALDGSFSPLLRARPVSTVPEYPPDQDLAGPDVALQHLPGKISTAREDAPSQDAAGQEAQGLSPAEISTARDDPPGQDAPGQDAQEDEEGQGARPRKVSVDIVERQS